MAVVILRFVIQTDLVSEFLLLNFWRLGQVALTQNYDQIFDRDSPGFASPANIALKIQQVRATVPPRESLAELLYQTVIIVMVGVVHLTSKHFS